MAWPPCLASGRSQSSKTKRPHRWLPIVFADTPGAMKALTRFNEDEELHGCKIGTASDVSARRILRLSVKIMKSNVECREPELFCGEVWACVRDAKKSRASDPAFTVSPNLRKNSRAINPAGRTTPSV